MCSTRIADDYTAFRFRARFRGRGDPVSRPGRRATSAPSTRMPWYRGPTLRHLDTVIVPGPLPKRSACPCSWSTAPTQTSAATRAHRGGRRSRRRLRARASVRRSSVTAIVAACIRPRGRQRRSRSRSRSPTRSMSARGDVIVAQRRRRRWRDQFEARILWMMGTRLARRTVVPAEAHACETNASVTAIKYREDVETGAHLAAKTLALNEIGVVQSDSSISRLAFEPYAREPRHRRLHPHRPASRSADRRRRPDRTSRCAARRQHALAGARRRQATRARREAPATALRLWFTGLSGSGKSTIANLVEKRLHVARPPHLPARRRQRAPRPEPRPRLHRGRPRREHPPRRRGGEADGRRRA